MKKLTALFLSLMLVFSLAACGKKQNVSGQAASDSAVESKEPETSAQPGTESQEENRPGNSESAEGKTLLVYFSMPETADPDNMTQDEEQSTVIIDGEVLGNTQYVAYVIQENTGADIFRIEPEIPYPTDHDTLVDLAAAAFPIVSALSLNWNRKPLSMKMVSRSPVTMFRMPSRILLHGWKI